MGIIILAYCADLQCCCTALNTYDSISILLDSQRTLEKQRVCVSHHLYQNLDTGGFHEQKFQIQFMAYHS